MKARVKPPSDAWYPVAIQSDLRGRPLARRLLGRPVVVFGTESGAAVLTDRCPHRSAALSRGRQLGDEIQCPYHGWRFDQEGRCTATPGSLIVAKARAEAVPSYVRDGLVWASLAPCDPAPKPLPAQVGCGGHDGFWWTLKASRAHWIEAIENLLDSAHPHFVHAGLVRGDGQRRRVKVTVRQGDDWVEAIYDEGARPSGFVPRLLEGIRTRSIGRFHPPATGQIIFEDKMGLKLALTVVFTPEGEDQVRPFAHFSTPRRILPAWFKRAALIGANSWILAQDRAVLSHQAAVLTGFDNPPPVLGPLDFLRPAIEALASGKRLEPGERHHQITL